MFVVSGLEGFDRLFFRSDKQSKPFNAYNQNLIADF
jgi:hypothetical protein